MLTSALWSGCGEDDDGGLRAPTKTDGQASISSRTPAPTATISAEEARQRLIEQSRHASRRLRLLTPQIQPGGAPAPQNTGGSPTMEEFMTSLVQDVDAYWVRLFRNAGLPEPQVKYDWIEEGQSAQTACDGEEANDHSAFYCRNDDTIYIGVPSMQEVWEGVAELPGNGSGQALGDLGVAWFIAHEYGHNVQTELGIYNRFEEMLPVMAFELQADCFAGDWANSAYRQGRFETGDLEEALSTMQRVGDFDTLNRGHHGTPDERGAAWKTGFDSGNPPDCDQYVDPNQIQVQPEGGDGGGIVVIGG